MFNGYRVLDAEDRTSAGGKMVRAAQQREALNATETARFRMVKMVNFMYIYHSFFEFWRRERLHVIPSV